MSDSVSPSSPQGDGIPGVPNWAYRAQYKVSEPMKKFWQKLFHNTPLTDLEIQQMTDTFVKNISQAMSKCANDAIKNLRKIRQELEEAGQ